MIKGESGGAGGAGRDGEKLQSQILNRSTERSRSPKSKIVRLSVAEV